MNRAKRATAPTGKLRGRLWVEIDGKPALTEAGADLLEQIDALGSLSDAGRRLRFSYRRAWMLLDAMNQVWPTRLVDTRVGGRRGGGAHLTKAGHAVLRAYRDLQLQMEHLFEQAEPAFYRTLASASAPLASLTPRIDREP